MRALPTLRVLDRCDVVGLAATPDGRRVTGARLHAAAEHDPGLAAAFVRVAGMVAPPRSLLRPRVVLRALRPRLHDRRA